MSFKSRKAKRQIRKHQKKKRATQAAIARVLDVHRADLFRRDESGGKKAQ